MLKLCSNTGHRLCTSQILSSLSCLLNIRSKKEEEETENTFQADDVTAFSVVFPFQDSKRVGRQHIKDQHTEKIAVNAQHCFGTDQYLHCPASEK